MISSTITSAASGSGNSNLIRTSNTLALPPSAHTLGAQFREIHKNTWLKRLTAEGKKITVGPKKSERSWVVFCVHDDTEALLEGYAEPRQAPAHNPEWVVSLRHTLHVSHALIPNSHEFEFVVALNNEIVRFHATSWEIMQEWVETLRAKLREMKILSPRENLYTKLPEVRLPLLPTRDPTSPLPAPPPVPAALVPGVERIVTHNIAETLETVATNTIATTTTTIVNTTTTTTITTTNATTAITSVTGTDNNIRATTTTTPTSFAVTTATTSGSVVQGTPKPTAMSNTLTQNLLNLLTDPLTAYNENINAVPQNPLDEDEDDEQLEIEFSHDSHDNDEFLLLSPTPKTRQRSTAVRNSIRVNINGNTKAQSNEELVVLSCENILPRYSVSATRSSIGSCDKSLNNINCKEQQKQQSGMSNNVTELQISGTEETNLNLDGSTNITIIEVSANNDESQDVRKTKAEIFQFPDIKKQQKQKITNENKDYKCNVQIIPSNGANNNNSQNNNNNNNITNNSSTVQVLPTTTVTATTTNISTITTVHVAGHKICPNISNSNVPVYGTCYNATTSIRNSPLMNKRIILSASSSSGVTNITVNDKTSSSHCDNETPNSTKKSHTEYYDKVFLSTSSPKTVLAQANKSSSPLQANSSRIVISETERKPNTPARSLNINISEKPQQATTSGNNYGTTLMGNNRSQTQINNDMPTSSRSATATTPARVAIPTRENNSVLPEILAHRPRLQRGATEAVITRASRRDVHVAGQLEAHNRAVNIRESRTKSSSAKNSSNNNEEVPMTSMPVNAAGAAVELRQSIMQQRRRSSSTSDAHAQRNARNSNNNELLLNNGPERGNNAHGIRMQPPPHVATDALINSPKRLTLREQQVMQLRREIMHPGGVRLQLRRKDCVGSIAWVDCFNTVWVAGWKQKEHPVLYNALHIGDQLLTIAGMAVSTAGEANKIIRNANTLFVEVLVRRIPFGRGYAIRREREGQCLGLIRDGNTATIVDVVPNSLAARHGLPPKAQSCDGTSLTFWVLTEINGRPLNLFFKENEIRDRLNSVGRDISILVQPADLISKLKKQLKSLRGYKDYLVQ